MPPLNISHSRRSAIAARDVLTLIGTIALAACQDAPSAPSVAHQSPAPNTAISGGCGITACPPAPPILFVRDTNNVSYIYRAYPDGTGVKRLAKGTRPAWSPDGTKVAFVRVVSGYSQIFTMNADGTGVTQRTFGAAKHRDPAWSPGGGRIAFSGTVKDASNLDIYVMNVNGTGLVRITSKTAVDREPAWRRDGKYLAFTSNRAAGVDQVFKINVDGTTHIATALTSVLGYTASSPAYSPDGTKLLFNFQPLTPAIVGRGSAPCGMAVANTDVTTLVRIESTQFPCGHGSFSPDGKQIAFDSYDSAGQGYRVFTMNLDGSNVAQVTPTTPPLTGRTSDTRPAWKPPAPQ